MNVSALPPESGAEGEAAPRSISDIVESLAHLLPEQAPLHAFVHHNTLHAFEHLPFLDAVLEASTLLGTEPFQSEAAFAAHVDSGRIRPDDIDVIIGLSPDHTGDVFASAAASISRGDFRRHRLRHLFPLPRRQALRYILAESDVLRRVRPDVPDARHRQLLAYGTELGASNKAEAAALEAIWQALNTAASKPTTAPAPTAAAPRRRDDLLRLTGIDTDELVHPLLIRLAAAFLDQGVAYWSMPDRDDGFLSAVRALYRRSSAPPHRAFRGLTQVLTDQQSQRWTAEATIEWALQSLEVPPARWPETIRASLLALRGWAGMMHHLEHRPDRAPIADPGARLLDFLAVRLILDTLAAQHVLNEAQGATTFAALDEGQGQAQQGAGSFDPDADASAALRLTYEAFLAAQYLPVDPAALCQPQNAAAWLKEVADFDHLARRSLLHLAYERRHRVEVLDGLSAHCLTAAATPPQPKFQAAFCIDDREESLRRHLEECFPAVDTFGYAGFYGVAMNYQGLDDVRSRPLCPVSIRPRHLIVERALDPAEEAAYRRRQKTLGTLRLSSSVGSKTLTRGGVASVVFGMAAIAPLVLRSIFPRYAESWAHALDHRVAPTPKTRLVVELEGPWDGPLQPGYTVDEMTDIVDSALKTMHLIDKLCDIVLIVGHGSSSLNNPHEAAHDCGATGGGRGGSNARAFAVMANHPKVRAQLAQRGLEIPETTWFVGGYHNTCDDAMTYYDEALIPDALLPLLREIKEAMAEACVLDAHERCRRFETAPATLSNQRAMNFARIHANDLAEPRPEYGHATNAVCIVGRRERTRGLFLDRRAFLVSYDPTDDPEGYLLASLLLSVGPVGAGINLEYYFSFVDPSGYGSGTKLPHNITGLIGVMDGHSTDLRTGLPWQMVEIHEPVRLVTIVEAKLSVLEAILNREPALAQLIGNGWIQVIGWDPDSEQMAVFRDGAFHAYEPEVTAIATVERSVDHYGGQRHHLPLAHIKAAFGGARP